LVEVLEEARSDQLGRHDFAEAFDVHGSAVSEVLEAAFELAHAVPGGATKKHIFFDQGALADRTVTGRAGRFRLRGTLGKVYGNDGGDHLARFFDPDKISDADVFAGDLLEVMKGGTGDGGTAQENGSKFRHGGDDASPADLEGHVEDACFGLFGGILIGDGPAGGFIGLAKNLLLVEAIDLDDRTVGGEGKFGSGLIQFSDGADNLFGATDMAEPFVTGQAPSENLTVELFLGFQREVGGIAETVENNGERAFGNFAGIEEFEGAGGGIAGIGEKRLPFFFAALVEGGKGGFRKIHFATEFDARRKAGDEKRKVADGLNILGDIISALPVTAGEPLGEATILVAEADREAVDLGFDCEFRSLPVEIFFNPIKKLLKLLLAIGVVEALHSDGVGDGSKRVEGGTADLAGGGVFVCQFGMRSFEIEELSVKTVVGGIGNFGTSFDVVEVVVAANLLEESGVALDGGGAHRRRRRARPRETPRMSANQSRTDTSRPGARRWLCSSRAPRREPVIPRTAEG